LANWLGEVNADLRFAAVLLAERGHARLEGCCVRRKAFAARQGSDLRMNPFLWLFDTLVNLYIFVVLAHVVLTILVSFNVVNARQPLVAQVGEFLYRATEPVLAPIRRRMPNLGAFDISPLVLIIGLTFLVRLVHYIF
jgi:YggT family protein